MENMKNQRNSSGRTINFQYRCSDTDVTMHRPSPHNIQQYFQPQTNLQWKPNPGARAPFYKGHQMINNYRPTKNYNEEHWCETCDRGFPNIDLLNRHKLQHQKCNIDGCQFIAHPKVITKHIQMQHSSGLYKKIAKLDNPEEIKKWREERKKKYPTKSNIEKKAAELKEKIDRGEKMGLKYDRHNRKYKTGEGINRKHHSSNENQPRSKFKRNNYTENNKKQPPVKKVPKTLPLVEEKRKLKPFAGIQDLEMNNDDHSDVDTSHCTDLIDDNFTETFNHIEETLNMSEPVVCGALSSLICDYGSSDEEIVVENKVNKIVNNNTNILKQSQNKTPQNIEVKKDLLQHEKNQINVAPPKFDQSDDDSGPEEVKVIKKDVVIHHPKEETIKSKNVIVKNKNINGHKKTRFNKPKYKLPSTLLQKLLCKEMRQERNIILQCIRHIKMNNYFDKVEQIK